MNQIRSLLGWMTIVAALAVLILSSVLLGETLYIVRHQETPPTITPVYHVNKELDQKPIVLRVTLELETIRPTVVIPTPTPQATSNGPLPDNSLILDAYDYVSQYDCTADNGTIRCEFDDGLIILSQGSVTLITQ